jgi:plastocyanin
MRTIWWAAVLVIAGCGSGSTTASTNSVPPTPTPAAGTAMVHVGTNGAMAFFPQSVNVNPGDTVTWIWDSLASDGTPHTVTSGTPGAADGLFCSLPAGQAPSPSACNSTSYAQGPGATYSHTFATAGTFPYYCAIHGAMMTGTVVVGDGGGGGGGGSAGGGGSGGGGY